MFVLRDSQNSDEWMAYVSTAGVATAFPIDERLPKTALILVLAPTVTDGCIYSSTRIVLVETARCRMKDVAGHQRRSQDRTRSADDWRALETDLMWVKNRRDKETYVAECTPALQALARFVPLAHHSSP